MVPVMKLCRLFDAAKPGSLSFVYRAWSMLSESVLLSIAKPAYKSIVTPTIVRHVKNTVVRCWRNFDFDVYGAAFLLNPYFHSKIQTMRVPTPGDDGESEDVSAETEFHDLVDQTLRALRVLVRRFPPALNAKARKVPLSSGDPQVLETLEDLRREIYEYFDDPGRGLTWTPPIPNSERRNVLPGTYWRTSRPSKLRYYARFLVDGTAGSTSTERFHWLNARTRTVLRNRMGYVRSQSFAFLDQYYNATPTSPLEAFDALMGIIVAFDKVSDEDETFLLDMDARMTRIDADVAAEELRTEGAGMATISQSVSSALDDEERYHARRRQSRRKVSSRFAAALEAERSRNQAEHVDEEEDDEDYEE